MEIAVLTKGSNINHVVFRAFYTLILSLMETKQGADSLPTGIDNPPVLAMAPCRKQMIENKANTGILRQMLKIGGCIST